MSIRIRNHRVAIDGTDVTYRATPNKGGTLAPDGIILHDTAGGLKAEGSIAWLCDPAAKASAHVVIARDGTITQLAPFNVRCWHAGKSSWRGRANVNGFAVGIEIVNPGKMTKVGDGYRNDLGVTVRPADDLVVEHAATEAHGSGWWLHYAPEQIEAVVGLCVALRQAYPSIGWIATHWLISPGRKIDTNPLFPLERVRSLVLGGKVDEADAPDGDNDGIVAVASLNLRSEASAGSAILDELSRGTRVLVRDMAMNASTRWLRVDVAGSGRSGWVAARYVDMD